MDTGKIAHIWNVNLFMTKLNCPQSRNLQTFYMRTCKKICKGSGLPKHKFGPTAMCVHCSSLWTSVDHSIRIIHGRPMSKSVHKIVNAMNKDKNIKLPRVRATLGRKALRKRTNKMAIKCSVCSRITKLSLAKPQKEKVKKINVLESCTPQKQKKKKVKDKTAGLIIPQTLKSERKEETAPPQKGKMKTLETIKKTVTPAQKLKKLNINRLKDIVSKGETPSKSKTLHSFLSGL